METNLFAQMEERFRSHGPDALFEALAAHARDQLDHGLLFHTLAMQARLRLGLPLIELNPQPELSSEQRTAYEDALRAAARETGNLMLASGDIVAAWPYFKALGEHAPVAAAIEQVSEGENLDGVIEIALQEGANIRKGFDLLIRTHGICSAITWFGGNRNLTGRQDCLILLVEELYREVRTALWKAVSVAEPDVPEDARVADLIARGPWLFANMRHYTDSTHVASVLGFARDLTDRGALRMAAELADYGQALDPMFRFRGDPPFDDAYADNGIYLRALLGEQVEEAIAHFREKITAPNAGPGDPTPAEVLIGLLARLERYPEAIQASLDYLPASPGFPLSCPSVNQLCQMAADFSRLQDIARQRDDLLGFAAGLLACKSV
jgi:hypothetical protein